MATQESYSLPSIMPSDSSLPWLLPLITMLVVFAIIPFFYNIYCKKNKFFSVLYSRFYPLMSMFFKFDISFGISIDHSKGFLDIGCKKAIYVA